MTDQPSLNVLAGKNIEDVFASLKTSAKGLSTQEAAARLKIYGINEFAGKKNFSAQDIFIQVQGARCFYCSSLRPYCLAPWVRI